MRAGMVATGLYAGERWAGLMWGDDLPWAALASACFGGLLLIEAYRMRRKTRDDDPATRGVMREVLAANNLELQSIRDAAQNLPMEPLGADGTTYGSLPNGTNLVKLPDGSFRLALPVRIAGKATALMSAGSATLTVIKPEDRS
ncbi:MAG: hypothetical protein OYH76_11630 [Defluviicoccus sp.]|nr:hypothetical protein [Defluviicoccus sp.]